MSDKYHHTRLCRQHLKQLQGRRGGPRTPRGDKVREEGRPEWWQGNQTLVDLGAEEGTGVRRWQRGDSEFCWPASELRAKVTTGTGNRVTR